MTRALAALAAALPLSFATAQGTSHSHHGTPSASAPPAPAAQAAPVVKAEADASPASGTLYRSAFEGYRPFSDEVVVKDWRKANDEARDAGGHLGLMKGQPAPRQGHGAHGAKQPPAGDRK